MPRGIFERRRTPIIDRFWRHVNKDGPIVREELGPCWIWTAACYPNGYGQMGSTPGRSVLVHRFSYETFNGPIEDGKHVCHHCDVRACVNPKHLWLGTRSDNIKDMVAKGRHRPETRSKGEGHHSSKLTRVQVLEIHRRLLDGEAVADLAREYGLTHRSVKCIQIGRSWAWLTGVVAS